MALINFLIGAVLAFVGAVQLVQFGATIYVADLVAIGVARELGALMTGIVMAGRTGASFAAVLGTMTVNEEVDALRTMGLRPVEFLVLPRVLATVLMMPALVAYADLMGLLGGAFVAVKVLDIGTVEYLRQTQNALALRHVLIGLGKSVVFGAIVAIDRLLLRHPLRPQRRRGRRGHHEGRGHRDPARGRGGRRLHGRLPRAALLGRAVSEPAQIEVRDLTMGYGDRVVQEDLAFTVAAGRDLRRHGRQRLRQEHADAPHGGPQRAAPRATCTTTARDTGRPARSGGRT